MTSPMPFSRYLSIRSAYSPAWLENGQRVAFLTDITDTPQVWAVDADGGWPDQLFLSRGYAILATNVRGSSGYGKAYMALDDVELQMDSVADLKYAVEWLRACSETDPDRIAIYGCSYSGFMVLSAITTYPDLWAAAVDVVGITNWVTFLENSGTWRRAHREKEYGSLEKDRDFLQSISPIYKMDQIQYPLTVIHGANDPRTPVTEAD